MAGHNKWSKVKHKKAAVDAKKSKIFSRLAHAIALEARSSNGDVNSPGLRSAIERARAENMPQDNIERAIRRGTGADQGMLEEVLYESYGPGGCALVITGLTDNKNRTSAEVRHLLSKNGLAMAGQGAALWAFEKKEGSYIPTTTVPLSDEDTTALERIVDLLNEHDDVQDVFTNAE